jgi:hypothetical protein
VPVGKNKSFSCALDSGKNEDHPVACQVLRRQIDGKLQNTHAFFYYLGGGRCRLRTPREGLPRNHMSSEGMRAGRSHLTAGHGRLVWQPWWIGDQTQEQRSEAMPSAGYNFWLCQSMLNPDEPFFLLQAKLVVTCFGLTRIKHYACEDERHLCLSV